MPTTPGSAAIVVAAVSAEDLLASAMDKAGELLRNSVLGVVERARIEGNLVAVAAAEVVAHNSSQRHILRSSSLQDSSRPYSCSSLSGVGRLNLRSW